MPTKHLSEEQRPCEFVTKQTRVRGMEFCNKKAIGKHSGWYLCEFHTFAVQVSVSYEKTQEIWKIVNKLLIKARSEKRWVELPFDKEYLVSNYGEIYSKKSDRQLKPSKDYFGYLMMEISGKIMRVHKLVALSFIPNSFGKPCINHKDGNKLNNNVENLEWCTYSENLKHAIDTGLRGEPWNKGKIIKKHKIINGEMFLKCSVCKKFKEKKDFPTDKSRSLKIKSKCKSCTNKPLKDK